jgi:hypothetical protein
VADHQAETRNAAQIEFWNSAAARAWATNMREWIVRSPP